MSPRSRWRPRNQAGSHARRRQALDCESLVGGLDTTVLLDLTAGVAPKTTEAALAQLEDAGVRLEGAPVLQG